MPSLQERETYMRANDLDGLALEVFAFTSFFDDRRARMLSRLKSAIGI